MLCITNVQSNSNLQVLISCRIG